MIKYLYIFIIILILIYCLYITYNNSYHTKKAPKFLNEYFSEEIISSEKNNKLHFIEVKSVARETLDNVLHETSDYRPEENMHPWKLKRLSRTIQTYLLSNKVSEEKEWQLDLLVVFLDLKNRKARVKTINDIIL